MSQSNENYVKPITLTVTGKDGKETKYILEFDRDTVRLAERNGFEIGELKQLSKFEELWYYAFRMHQPRISRKETDALLYDPEYGFGGLGGLPDGMAERLGELYVAPYNTLAEPSKNCKVTVEL